MAATALGWPTRPSAVRRRSGPGADDDRLVARVRAGDDTAFEAIYDRYARRLLAFCYQMLRSREEAEDALQHSFVAAYRTLRSSNSAIELRPWLYTIARNRCLSLLRSRRKDISLDAAPDYGGVAEGLADEVQRRSDLGELVEDLRRLPDDQRAALVLFELGGLPHDEIAAVLDVRREKVKALVFQAREGLIRDRRARDLPCTEMREQLASLNGRVPRRSMLRRHVDRCASCALFEAEVGRQRAGLGLILPLLPTAGLKTLILGSVLSRGAAVAGGGASAGVGGGAALLGGAGAGGGGAACAGACSAAAGLTGAGAGAGAAAGAAGSGGGILAGAAAGGVTGGLATAGGAGTIAAALGTKGATGVVVKLLAVVAVGGGVAGTGDLGSYAPAVGRAPAVQFDTAATGVASPVTHDHLAAPGRPATDTPVDAGNGAAPPAVHDPLMLGASDPTLVPTTTAHTTPIGAGPTPPPPPLGSLPANGGVSPGPTQPPATSPAPPAAQPNATSQAPPATATPAGATPTAGAHGTGATPTHGTTASTTAPAASTPAPATSTAPAAGPAAGSSPSAAVGTAVSSTAPAPDTTPSATSPQTPDAARTTPTVPPGPR